MTAQLQHELPAQISQNSLVSIIIPTFNGARTIRAALDSVKRDSYKNKEIIVVDDGSTDQTPEILNALTASTNSVRIIRHTQNLGLSASLNDGISHSLGSLLLILHQDCELLDNDWISEAVSIMNSDPTVAVVTGYYGIAPDVGMNFAMKIFGIMRNQIHKKPSIAMEEVSFSEGKCDLYRRDALDRIGLFPTRYRIAGEDSIVSYQLRRAGYRIMKGYHLPVIQKYAGKAETISGNLQKEFIFGKAMGSVFATFRLYAFKGLSASKYSRTRSLHRAGQPTFVLMIILFLALIPILGLWALFLLALLLSYRLLFYSIRFHESLKAQPNLSIGSHFRIPVIAVIGILSDFMYSAGFAYGLIRDLLGLSL